MEDTASLCTAERMMPAVDRETFAKAEAKLQNNVGLMTVVVVVVARYSHCRKELSSRM
jgi:hypothetical protein